MEKACPICGELFEDSRSNVKYCSDCRSAHKKPGKAAQLMHARISESKRRYYSPTVEDFKCSECGKMFRTTHKLVKKWRDERFCSTTCRNNYAIHHAKCRWCGVPVSDKPGVTPSIATHFCCEEHREAFHIRRAEQEGTLHECPECGKKIWDKRRGTYCSKECYLRAVDDGTEARRQAEIAKAAPQTPKPTIKRRETCPVCGKDFIKEYLSMKDIDASFHGCCKEHEKIRIKKEKEAPVSSRLEEYTRQCEEDWFSSLPTISDMVPEAWHRPRSASPLP